MPFWLVLVLVIGGLFLLGFLYDFAAKRKKWRTDFTEEPQQQLSTSQRVYNELSLQQSLRNSDHHNS
ncbi:hypothetical protein LOK74_00370 [Brevibacillus humidisoli]|uniref:hypothetical protein n=1 Tax=Brevibacillus humidisoli TaxID=2895522 RepID=UPI001E3AF2D2|nr:hypothetical protein [Brevibacillus humidisoli]UFJ41054.1 hypothetical protein LOK74_00370 [Brevibacillus humidisoli]